jgi:hypothetical protein
MLTGSFRRHVSSRPFPFNQRTRHHFSSHARVFLPSGTATAGENESKANSLPVEEAIPASYENVSGIVANSDSAGKPDLISANGSMLEDPSLSEKTQSRHDSQSSTSMELSYYDELKVRQVFATSLSDSLLNRGSLPGPFNVFKKHRIVHHKNESTTPMLVSRIVSGFSILLTRGLYERYNAEFHDQAKDYREALLHERRYNGSIEPDWPSLASLYVAVALHKKDPVSLCKRLRSLLLDYGLGHRQYRLAVSFLFYHFLGQSLLTGGIPSEFYDVLIDPELRYYNRILLLNFPMYSLLQKCPPSLRNSLEGMLKEFDLMNTHWERHLIEAQRLSLKGQHERALDLMSTIDYNQHRWNVEYVNTIYSILRYADQQNVGVDRVGRIVSGILNLGLGSSRLHPDIWIRLIDFSQKRSDKISLHLIAESLEDKPYVGVRTFLRLAEALDEAGGKPLDPFTNPAVDHWAKQNRVLAAVLLHTWRNYTKPSKVDRSDAIQTGTHYSHLTPIYRRYYNTTVLNALSLPCQSDKSVNPLPKHRETQYALATMLHTYLSDHKWDIRIILTLYRRFAEVLRTRPDITSQIQDGNTTGLFVCFLDAIVKSGHEFVDLCISLVAEIVKLINNPPTSSTASTSTPSSFSNPETSRSPQQIAVSTHTWLHLLTALARAGHFAAAYKILCEIKTHHPLAYGMASEILLKRVAAAEADGRTIEGCPCAAALHAQRVAYGVEGQAGNEGRYGFPGETRRRALLRDSTAKSTIAR